jgi:hypothetical protein
MRPCVALPINGMIAVGFGLGGKDLPGRRNWIPSIPLRERKHPRAENLKLTREEETHIRV